MADQDSETRIRRQQEWMDQTGGFIQGVPSRGSGTSSTEGVPF